ncbi:hypothetical protein FACS1894201_05760 [Bacteroidia bacterium]|nr:hypothetical protein FACS1894201_05760 [Bacteroidia bacterium]
MTIRSLIFRIGIAINMAYLCGQVLNAQSGRPFVYQLADTIPVEGFNQPWTGGLNACLFGEIDLNMDGIKDLIVYDQHRQKPLTFIRTNENVIPHYRYEARYESDLPTINSWFITQDFNGDGKADIFTFDGVAGMTLYQNVSTATTVRFVLHTKRITAKLFDTYETLYCSSVNYPAIYDVDGDGDLDIVTFWVPSAGNTLYFYKNWAKERYGSLDSLDFVIANTNWGCFREDESSNGLTLNTCGSSVASSKQQPATPSKHTGSSVFIAHLNGDDLPDLLLGDFGYPNIVALYNGGTGEDARMVSMDTAFPHNSVPVNLLNSPAVYPLDVDGDNVPELVFSPFNAAPFSTQAPYSNWVYKNMGTAAIPDYQLISQSFLQDNMLDFGIGAYPTIGDLNKDGLLDIIVGNYGITDTVQFSNGSWESVSLATLHELRNIGTATQPSFRLQPIRLDPPPLKTALCPTVGNLNNNPQLDLLLGTESGELLWYEQSTTTNDTTTFQLVQSNILNEFMGLFIAPQLVDLNNDGLLDLVLGEQRTIWTNEQGKVYYKGNVNYFQNTGTPENPVFTLITDSLGGVDAVNREVSTFGYSKPYFFKDTTQQLWLYCGREDGRISVYGVSDISASFEDRGFVELDDGQELYNGQWSSPAVADFNQDGIPDLVVGNHAGGLHLYYGKQSDPSAICLITPPMMLDIHPNPAYTQIIVENQIGALCEIMDILGHVRISQRIQTASQSIDIHNLMQGVYILKISINGQSSSTKFVKQ